MDGSNLELLEISRENGTAAAMAGELSGLRGQAETLGRSCGRLGDRLTIEAAD
jgi:hypothetical protein